MFDDEAVWSLVTGGKRVADWDAVVADCDAGFLQCASFDSVRVVRILNKDGRK